MSDNLPQELIVEILSRLPPKTLVRFCGVCKSWRSLISSPDFISTHTRQHTNSSHNPPRKLFRQFCHTKEHYSVYLDNNSFDLDSESPITFPFEGISYLYFRIVGCCNGLLCLYNDLFAGSNTVILWNPAIRRKLILPRPQERPDNAVVDVRYEIPRLCKDALGFGFSTRMDDFKVVKISYVGCYSGYSLPPMVEIYTVKGGAWRVVDSISPSPLHSLCIVGHFWSQVFVNGAVHWIAYNALWRGRGGIVHSSIMSFDLNDEVFGEVIMPECLTTEPPTNMNVHAVGELLSVIRFNRFDRTDTCISVWVMKEYAVANSWCRLYNIDLGFSVGRVLDVRNNGEILLGDIGCELTGYNPRTNEFNSLRTELNLLHATGSTPAIYVSTYWESLALLAEGDVIHYNVKVVRRQLSEYYVSRSEEESQKIAQKFYVICASRIR